MYEILIKIIPLDFAATLSPGIFALTIVLLGSKFHPKLKTISLLIGTLIVGIGIALLGFTLGQAAPEEMGQNLAASIIDLTVGAIFIFLGIRAVVSKERRIKSSKEDKGPQIAKLIIAGFIISATNFDALFLSFTAAKEVGEASDIGDVGKIILLIINLLFFTLPICLPLFLYIILPDFAGRILTKVNQFVLKYSKYIIFGLFVIFGIFFIYHGLKFFV